MNYKMRQRKAVGTVGGKTKNKLSYGEIKGKKGIFGGKGEKERCSVSQVGVGGCQAGEVGGRWNAVGGGKLGERRVRGVEALSRRAGGV